jgi:hypothetical protein
MKSTSSHRGKFIGGLVDVEEVVDEDVRADEDVVIVAFVVEVAELVGVVVEVDWLDEDAFVVPVSAANVDFRSSTSAMRSSIWFCLAWLSSIKRSICDCRFEMARRISVFRQ